MKFCLIAIFIVLSAALIPHPTIAAQTEKECAASCFGTKTKCEGPDSDGDKAGPNRQKRCMNEYIVCLRPCSAATEKTLPR
jgi:hypothetical protein